MQNLIIVDPKHIKRIFDLKGSEVDRLTKNIEYVDKLQALKDQDFRWMKKVDDQLISFNVHQKDLIEEALVKDLSMLADCDLMDYSILLVIIENYDSDSESTIKDELEEIFKEPRLIRKVFPSDNGKYIYIIGLIDFLQKYNLKKAIEHRLKRIVHDDKASAVDSKLYAFRMHKFFQRHVFDKY